MIPFSDPSASYKSYKSQIDLAIKRVLDSGWYVLGGEVKLFENEFAAFHGENFHATGVANGTDAIALCLRGLGLGLAMRSSPHPTPQWPRLPVLNRQVAPRYLQISTRIQDALPRIQLRREWVPIPGQSCRFIFMGNQLKCTRSWRLPKP